MMILTYRNVPDVPADPKVWDEASYRGFSKLPEHPEQTLAGPVPVSAS
jgi:hypothetical protein